MTTPDISTGLTDVQAARQLADDGPNQLRTAPETPSWQRFVSPFHDPLVLLQLGAMGISLAAW